MILRMVKLGGGQPSSEKVKSLDLILAVLGDFNSTKRGQISIGRNSTRQIKFEHTFALQAAFLPGIRRAFLLKLSTLRNIMLNLASEMSRRYFRSRVEVKNVLASESR